MSSGSKSAVKDPIKRWAPRPIPRHPLDRKASDPRLAAALAARERWHGRSGRPALKSPTQAVAFVRERRLVHSTTASALPNLLDPIVGRALEEEERSSGQAVTTLQAWMPEIRSTPDILELRLCFERPTFVHADLWPCLEAIGRVRDEEVRKDRSLPLEVREALEILDRRGVIAVERLGEMLDLDKEDAERLAFFLETKLVAVTRNEFDEDEERDILVIEPLVQWIEQHPHQERELTKDRSFTFLLIAALRSAVALWPDELEAIFPWTEAERELAIQEAMTTGTMIPYYEDGQRILVASPVPR